MSIEAPQPITRQTPEFLTQLAEDIVKGLVFSNAALSDPSDIPRVWMPIALGGFSAASKEWIESLGLVYSYLSDAQPMSVNGLPSFFSLKLLHKEDMPFLIEKIEAFEKALNSIRVTA